MKSIIIPNLGSIVIKAFQNGDFVKAEKAEKEVDNVYLELQKEILGERKAAFSCKKGGLMYVWSKSLKSEGIQKSCFWYNSNGELEALSDIQICNKDELIREEEHGVEIVIM